jgi:hypothetical protein
MQINSFYDIFTHDFLRPVYGQNTTSYFRISLSKPIQILLPAEFSFHCLLGFVFLEQFEAFRA